jgi:hypothetical protein
MVGVGDTADRLRQCEAVLIDLVKLLGDVQGLLPMEMEDATGSGTMELSLGPGMQGMVGSGFASLATAEPEEAEENSGPAIRWFKVQADSVIPAVDEWVAGWSNVVTDCHEVTDYAGATEVTGAADTDVYFFLSTDLQHRPNLSSGSVVGVRDRGDGVLAGDRSYYSERLYPKASS